MNACCGIIPGRGFFIGIEVKLDHCGLGVGLCIDPDLRVGVSFSSPVSDEDGLLNDGVDRDVDFQGFIGVGNIESLEFFPTKCGGGFQDFVGQLDMKCRIGLFQSGQLIIGNEGDVGRSFRDEIFRALVQLMKDGFFNCQFGAGVFQAVVSGGGKSPCGVLGVGLREVLVGF